MKKPLGSILVFIFLIGCGHAVVQHPGAVNSFDNNAYDTLRIEEAALLSAKASLATSPQISTAYTAAKEQYNITIVLYKTYHLAAVAGKNPSSTELSASIADLVAKIAAILKATGVVK